MPPGFCCRVRDHHRRTRRRAAPSGSRKPMRLINTATNAFRLVGVAALCAVSLAAQSSNPQQSLIQAIQHGDTPTVSRLLASGANPNVKDEEGVPALMLATLFADTACVEQLLKRGADPNQADTVGA